MTSCGPNCSSIAAYPIVAWALSSVLEMELAGSQGEAEADPSLELEPSPNELFGPLGLVGVVVAGHRRDVGLCGASLVDDLDAAPNRDPARAVRKGHADPRVTAQLRRPDTAHGSVDHEGVAVQPAPDHRLVRAAVGIDRRDRGMLEARGQKLAHALECLGTGAGTGSLDHGPMVVQATTDGPRLARPRWRPGAGTSIRRSGSIRRRDVKLRCNAAGSPAVVSACPPATPLLRGWDVPVRGHRQAA